MRKIKRFLNCNEDVDYLKAVSELKDSGYKKIKIIYFSEVWGNDSGDVVIIEIYRY